MFKNFIQSTALFYFQDLSDMTKEPEAFRVKYLVNEATDEEINTFGKALGKLVDSERYKYVGAGRIVEVSTEDVAEA